MPKTIASLALSVSVLALSSPTAAQMGGATDSGTGAVVGEAPATSPDDESPETMNANPLLNPWTGPYEGVPQWDKVSASDFPDAFAQTMASTKAEYEAILANPAEPTFENTMVPLELAGEEIGRVFSYCGVYTSNLSSP